MALTGQTMSLKLLRWCVIRLKLAFTIASKIRKHNYEQRAGQCKNHKIPDYTTHGPVSRVTCRHVTRVTRVSLWLLMCVWSDSARPWHVTRDPGADPVTRIWSGLHQSAALLFVSAFFLRHIIYSWWNGTLYDGTMGPGMHKHDLKSWSTSYLLTFSRMFKECLKTASEMNFETYTRTDRHTLSLFIQCHTMVELTLLRGPL